MKNGLLAGKGIAVFRAVMISAILAAVAIGFTACAQPTPTQVIKEGPKEVKRGATLAAIEHFSIIAGTTWSGAPRSRGKADR